MRLLVLAGTGEAQVLISALLEAGHDVTASLAGATRAPKRLPCKTRIGGFGGAAGFLRYVKTFKPQAVIDATHPFAHRITNRTARLCAEVGVPYLHLLRPGWAPDPSKGILEIPDIAALRREIPAGARVFLATGRQTLDQFAGFDDCHLICRQIDPPDGPFPFANGRFLIGRPPFSVAYETALFADERIDWLVVKNAGGAASYSKIEAAAALNIPVRMLARPEMPDAPRVHSLEAAIEWVEQHADY